MKFKSIVLILIAIGFIIALAVYFQYEKKNNVSLKSQITQDTAEQTNQGEIANWKTYKNEKYGFEIKYPQNFYVNETENYIDNNLKFIVDFSEYTSSPSKEYPGVRIQNINDKPQMDFKEYINQLIKRELESSNDVYGCNKSLNNISNEDINIDGVIGSKLNGFCGFGSDLICVYKNEKVFSMGNSLADEKVFEQMITTFKFTK